MPELLMPRLSDSMEEGTIVRWLVADGAEVRRGQEVVEIETDKATMEYEADASGPLRIVVAEGEAAAVGVPIAVIGAASPAAGAPDPDPAIAPPVAGAAAAAPPARPAGGRSASPVARRFASRLGVDLATVEGTGPHGRILKADVLAAAAAPAVAPAPAPAPSAGPAAAAAPVAVPDGVRVEEPTRLQQLVARRMVDARASAPSFTVEMAVDMTELLALRSSLKTEERPAPSVNDLLVRACALALREHPKVNARFADDRFHLHERIAVGIAVAAPGGALAVPVVHDADRLSVGTIAAETRRLIGAVRDGALTPADLDGGTFTISNLGMYGVSRFDAILHAGQAAILAVGGTERRPRWTGEAFEPRDVVQLTLACDHRILYGADAAAFLGSLRDRLERPMEVLL